MYIASKSQELPLVPPGPPEQGAELNQSMIVGSSDGPEERLGILLNELNFNVIGYAQTR
jgi:hypothetical protein